MSLALTTAHRDAYLSRDYVGDKRPSMLVETRRVFIKRGPNVSGDGRWRPVITPRPGDSGEWREIPGVKRATIEQSFDGNGVASCTLEMEGASWREVTGPLGIYHSRAPGWVSPFRSYTSNTPGLGNVPNDWNNFFATAAQVRVYQGYGEANRMPQFTGLLDSSVGAGRAGRLTVTARDFGQLPVDAYCWGWNLNPLRVHEPLTFVGLETVKELEASEDPQERADAAKMREKWAVITDLAQAVRQVLRWQGLPTAGVQSTGAPLKEATSFSRAEYIIDVIKKAQDVTGYIFFMGEPTDAYPFGLPIFRRSRVMEVVTPVAHFTSEQLLTDLTWTRDDEPLTSIIRVRGKANRKTGRRLGADHRKLVMGVYRPPWHIQTHNEDNPIVDQLDASGRVRDRDARILRHTIITQPLYKTEYQCVVAAIMVALQQALAAHTATVEVPTHPGIQLDDIVSVADRESGIASRCWVASKQTTFEQDKAISWKQTLGVALLDTPDVVETVNDLAAVLRLRPGATLVGTVSGPLEAGLPVQDTVGTVIDSDEGIGGL